MKSLLSTPAEDLMGKTFLLYSAQTFEPVCSRHEFTEIVKLIAGRGGVVEEIHIPHQLVLDCKNELINYLKLMIYVLNVQRPYQELEAAVVELVKKVAQYTTAKSNYSIFPSTPFSPVVAVDGVPFESIRTRIPITTSLL